MFSMDPCIAFLVNRLLLGIVKVESWTSCRCWRTRPLVGGLAAVEPALWPQLSGTSPALDPHFSSKHTNQLTHPTQPPSPHISPCPPPSRSPSVSSTYKLDEADSTHVGRSDLALFLPPPPSAMAALLSVYDKTGLLPFAKSLSELGFRLLGSGGTAKMIREAGLEIE